MIAALIRRELLANLLTFRLAVALVFAVTLSALTTFIGSLDYSRSMDAVEAEARTARQALDEATVYQQVVPRVVLPPDPLSILSRGVLRTGGRALYVFVDRIQIASWPIAAGYDNQLVKILSQVDFAGVVAVLLSFLAVVLGFDGFCGERERGTLRQVLANPVPRSSLVLGKLAGGSLSLWVPLSVAYLVSLLIMVANPDVHLQAGHWVRLFGFWLLSGLFLSTVFSLALLVSCLVRDADTSLVLCLFGWLVLGVGYMSLLPSAARYLVADRPWQAYVDAREQLREDHEQAMEAWDREHVPPGDAWLEGLTVDGALRYAHPEGYAWLQRRHAYEVERLLEQADARYRARYENQFPLIEQSRFVEAGALLSPVTTYQMLTRQLAGTTLDVSLHMAATGRRYRQTFLQWLRGRQAFSSRRWFSDDPLDQAPMIPDPAAVTGDMLAPDSPFMRQRMAWVRAQEAGAAGDARRRLDLSDMPAFPGDARPGLGRMLADMTPGLAVLILTLGGSVVLTLRRFDTYDPTP